MSEKREIDCWSCHATTSLADRSEFDGCCWGCGAELDLEAYLIKAMIERDGRLAALAAVTAERDQSRAEVAQLKNTLLDVTTRHFASSWKRRTDDAELERYLSDGIAQLGAERDRLLAEVEALCDRAIIVMNGEIRADAPLEPALPGCSRRVRRS